MESFTGSSDLLDPAFDLGYFMPDFFLNGVEILFGILDFNGNFFIHFGVEIPKVFGHDVHNFFFVCLGSHLYLFIVVFYGFFQHKLVVVPLSLLVG